MSEEERPLTTRTDGSLRGADGVYIADASTFPHLPAKGLTFTAMANAERVGEAVAKSLDQ
jgi:choline dehydrogenase-like flavoprotein